LIVFLHPAWLIALLLVPLAWLQWTRAGNAVPRRVRTKVAVLRCLILLLLVLALALPHWVGRRAGTDVLLLLDVSESMAADAQALAEEYTRSLEQLLGPGDRLGVVLFGAEPLIYKLPDETLPAPLSLLPDRGATDIERALRVAASLSPPGRSARIVLVSDGRETLGAAVEAASNLRPKGLPVYVLPAGSPPDSELLVDSFLLPRNVRPNEPFTARAVIFSTTSSAVRAYLFRDGTLLDERVVTVTPGRNLLEYSDLVQDTGTATYRVQIEGPADTFAQNNVGTGVVVAAGGSDVLWVTEDPAASSPLITALDARGLAVDVQSAQIPLDAGRLAGYGSVVLHNVPASHFAERQLRELERYVRELGGGLVLVGGDSSFGLGGYAETLLEEISPLQVRAPEHALSPGIAMALVIDKSGSMNEQVGGDGLSKLDLAKEAVLGVVGSLSARDALGVLAFDSRPEWIVPLGPVQQRDVFAARVLSLRADGGTNILVALEAAWEVMRQVEAGVKHIILLSDGQTAGGGFEELVTAMRSQGITVSTVGVGDADVALLSRIAEWGGGRHYYTDDPYRLPFIFASETRVIAPPPFEERHVEPFIVDRGDFLVGLPAALPPLDGFLVTHPKEAATVHVMATEEIALLASWRYGLGRVVAFAGALAPEWSAAWLTWDGLAQLWAQTVRWTMRPPAADGVAASLEVRQGTGRIWVDALDETGEYLNFLDLTAEVRAADGTSLSIPLAQVGPGRYEATFPAQTVGTWVAAVHDRESRLSAPLVATAALPYPEEYRALGPDRDFLQALAHRSGGRLLDGVDDLASVFAEAGEASGGRPLWQWLLVSALLLFMFDLGLRYVPPGTFAYTEQRLKARIHALRTAWKRRVEADTLTRAIRETQAREKTPPPIDSRQRASREAHADLARLRKARRASTSDRSKPADS
jgi:Mg-chelatase subunit ChlD